MTIEQILLFITLAASVLCLIMATGKPKMLATSSYLMIWVVLLAINSSLGWPTFRGLPDRFVLHAYTTQGIVISEGVRGDQRFYGGHFPPELKDLLKQSGGPLTLGQGQATTDKEGVPLVLEGQKFDAWPLEGETKLEGPKDMGPSYVIGPGRGSHPGER